MNIDERLNEFNEYCQTQLDSIHGLSAQNNETLFKKTLYISFLESLAKVAYPNKGVRERFVLFLKNFTDWTECNHHCPICLEDQNKIKQILNSSWYTTIDKVSIIDKEKDSQCEYVMLLYKARNSMVHQFQASTELEESTRRHDINLPFYNIIIRLSIDEGDQNYDEQKSIELVFPNTFLEKLSKEGLKKLIDFCKKKQINPFPEYYAEREIFAQKK